MEWGKAEDVRGDNARENALPEVVEETEEQGGTRQVLELLSEYKMTGTCRTTGSAFAEEEEAALAESWCWRLKVKECCGVAKVEGKTRKREDEKKADEEEADEE